jgi:hypothetical protein
MLSIKNQQGFIGAGVLIAVVLGLMVLGSGAYIAMHQSSTPQSSVDGLPTLQANMPATIQTSPQAVPVAAPTSAVVDTKANWKAYSNTEYGFEFKYPPTFVPGGFEVVENPPLFTFWINYNGNDKDFLLAVYPAVPYGNLAEYRKNNRQNAPVTLGGFVWYRFDVHSLVDYVQYYLENNGTIYRVDLNESKNENTLKDILSTFKLTK